MKGDRRCEYISESDETGEFWLCEHCGQSSHSGSTKENPELCEALRPVPAELPPRPLGTRRNLYQERGEGDSLDDFIARREMAGWKDVDY